MSDIIIADKGAMFGLPEVKVGFVAGQGGTQRTTKVIGKSQIMEMALVGTSISSYEAMRMGIVNKISEGNLLEEAIEIAKKLASHSLSALCSCKRIVNSANEAELI